MVNLEPSIAITQNFVPTAHLVNVLEFLKHKPDQVSGFKKDIKNPYDLFVQKMLEVHPDLLNRTLEGIELAQTGKKRKWDQLIDSNGGLDASHGAFSFGFGDQDEHDVP